MPMGDRAPPAAAAPDYRPGPHPPIAWRATSAGDGVWLSPQWTALTGQTDAEAQGIGWMDCIHPEDRGRILEGWHRARSTGVFAADLRIRAIRTGTYSWFRTQAVQGAEPEQGWSGTGIDVSDLYQRLTGESALKAALHHRIRNTLAVIRSIARRTAENSETVEDYSSHFDGRLAAFARTQSHIMRTGAEGVDLEGLLADELLAHQAGGRVSYSGPEVRLPPRLADQLGIALHELTANAVQHGALGREDGRLQVRWWTSGNAPAATLDLEWREDVPDGGVAAPDTEGFGLELLTRSLHYEVDAEVDLDFADTGLRCTIRLPLS
jgi:two-component sensor histidine kinase